MSGPQELSRVIIVLNEPQDPVNIGGVVRAMKNMGLARLRLVRPVDFDTYRITGVAHTGRDILDSVELFDDLPSALADCHFRVGTTARGRRVRREYRRPGEAASEVLEMARSGAGAAIVFGREDRGLSNTDLDLCGRIVVIPTDPEHSSLNLAQAVLVVAYELFLAAGGEPDFKAPRRSVVPASGQEMEVLFREVEATLHAIDFFKAHKMTPILRTVREVCGRASLDAREASLFRAMAIEVRKYLQRHGSETDPPSGQASG